MSSDHTDKDDVVKIIMEKWKSRTRRAPVVKNEEDVKMEDAESDNQVEDEVVVTDEKPAVKKRKAVANESAATAAGSRKGKSKYDDPIEMLTNPRAPLANVNLRDLLLRPEAWDVLNAEEKKSILAKFPDETEIIDAGTEDARPDFQALRNNDNFRADAARYSANLAKGWHDPEWIRQARVAHTMRQAGEYHDYLAERFEEDWGVPLMVPDKKENGNEKETENENEAEAGDDEDQEMAVDDDDDDDAGASGV